MNEHAACGWLGRRVDVHAINNPVIRDGFVSCVLDNLIFVLSRPYVPCTGDWVMRTVPLPDVISIGSASAANN